MRIVRLLLAAASVASVAALTAPANAAGALTNGCTYAPGVNQGYERTGTFSSGTAVATDGTSPEILCTVQASPGPNQAVMVTTAARGLACISSECKGDYWICYNADCHGDGWICAYSDCDGGSICYQADCMPPPPPPADNAKLRSPITQMSPTMVAYNAQPGTQLFSCTTVRWHTISGAYTENFYGCQEIPRA